MKTEAVRFHDQLRLLEEEVHSAHEAALFIDRYLTIRCGELVTPEKLEEPSLEHAFSGTLRGIPGQNERSKGTASSSALPSMPLQASGDSREGGETSREHVVECFFDPILRQHLTEIHQGSLDGGSGDALHPTYAFGRKRSTMRFQSPTNELTRRRDLDNLLPARQSVKTSGCSVGGCRPVATQETGTKKVLFPRTWKSGQSVDPLMPCHPAAGSKASLDHSRSHPCGHRLCTGEQPKLGARASLSSRLCAFFVSVAT